MFFCLHTFWYNIFKPVWKWGWFSSRVVWTINSWWIILYIYYVCIFYYLCSALSDLYTLEYMLYAQFNKYCYLLRIKYLRLCIILFIISTLCMSVLQNLSDCMSEAWPNGLNESKTAWQMLLSRNCFLLIKMLSLSTRHQMKLFKFNKKRKW